MTFAIEGSIWPLEPLGALLEENIITIISFNFLARSPVRSYQRVLFLDEPHELRFDHTLNAPTILRNVHINTYFVGIWTPLEIIAEFLNPLYDNSSMVCHSGLLWYFLWGHGTVNLFENCAVSYQKNNAIHLMISYCYQCCLSVTTWMYCLFVICDEMHT